LRPNPYQIAAFTQACREGSFSKAAARLGVTQSSITQHVAKLERAMGMQLFVRRRDGLEITSAGRDLFALTEQMAALEQRIQEKVQDFAALEDGHLRIIANAPRPILPLIAAYNRRYPKVRIDFTLFDWTSAMSLLREYGVDIALITEPALNDQLFGMPAGETCYKAHLLTSHPLAGREAISLSDLVNETVIVPEHGSLTLREFQRAQAQSGVRLSRIMRTTTFPVVKEAVLHGAGIGILLDGCLYPSPEIVAVPITELPQTYRNYLVTPMHKRHLRLIESFIEVMEELQPEASSSPDSRTA
jgi:DNA-binding transcriptional LysR family regulator